MCVKCIYALMMLINMMMIDRLMDTWIDNNVPMFQRFNRQFSIQTFIL